MMTEEPTHYDDLVIDEVHFSEGGMKILWQGKVGFGELCLMAQPGGRVYIDHEFMGEEFCKAVLAKVIDKYYTI
jgi:hypothetical protein